MDALIKNLNDLLDIKNIPDFPNAHNGLQIESSKSIRKIAAAVDACLPVIEQAITQNADLLLVHHGLFWQGLQPLTDSYYKKIKSALDHGLAIYSAHIPLDIHPTFGNNIQLAQLLSIKKPRPFFPWKSIDLGIRGELTLPRETLCDLLSEKLQTSIHLAPGGPKSIKNIGIITGGAGSEIQAIAKENIDTFITGEGPHWSYTAAEELGINLIYAGHYATETLGVQALGQHLAKKFKLDYCFIDHPTGL